MNRYFYSAWGRFMSPDGYMGSAHLGNPQSWNRYTYATNDPANRRDPKGQEDGYGDDGLFGWGDPGQGLADGSLFGDGDDGSDGLQGCGPIYDWCAVGSGTPDPPPPDPPDPPDPPPPPPPPPPPTPADPTPPTGPPSFELEAIGACVYPHGVGVTAVTGMLQLDITYQLLENDQPIFGNDTLNSLGAAVFENVTVTSGQPIDANGQWCPAFSPLCAKPGTMNSKGQFTDELAANPQGPSTANQSFSYYMKGGQYLLPVINFPGMPSVLQNAYSSTSVSVSNGTVVGNSKTQLCPGA